MKLLFATATLAILTATSSQAAPSAVCVTNGSEQAHFFAAEAIPGARKTGWLQPGETLCGAGNNAKGGVVSVFEAPDHEEGCSRLVSGDETETLLRYVDFDRCFWSSNTN